MSSPVSYAALRSRALRPLVALLSLLLLAPAVALLAAAPAHATEFVLEGTVEDGLGTPLDGVTVEALPVVDGVVGDEPVDTAETEGGAYALGAVEPLPPGDYQLRFSREGFESTRYGGTADPLTVTIDENGWIEGAEGGRNLLAPVTMLSATRRTVAGLVTTTGGAGLANAIVRAYLRDRTEVAESLSSDENGGFTISLPPGIFHLEYLHPSHEIAWYDGQDGNDPDDLTVPATGPVTPGCGGELCTVQLVPSTGGEEPGEFPIAGNVLDAIDQPIENVQVAVHGASPTAGGNATTDVDGAYSVSVAPGTYTVTFTDGATEPRFHSRSYGQVDDGDPAARVTVGPTGTLSVDPAEELVDNRLNPTTLPSLDRTLGGTVTFDGSGVDGITVRAHPAGGSEEPLGEAVTAGGGQYSFQLPIGRYDLQFLDLDGTAPHLAPQTLAAVEHGQVAAAVDVALVQADSGTIRGSVLDANDEPVVGATVRAVQPGTDVQMGSGTTDAEGAYAVSVPVDADYQLKVTKTGFDPTTYSNAEGVQTIHVTEAGVVEVDGVVTSPLHPVVLVSDPFRLTGTVTAATGGGLGGITVTAYIGSTVVAGPVPTAGDGSYSLDLRVGTYDLAFVDDDPAGGTYEPVRLDGAAAVVVNQAGQVGDTGGSVIPPVAMQVSDGVFDLRGGVLDEQFQPLPGATVRVVTVHSATVQAQAETDGNGGYAVAVPAGAYWLQFSAPGRATTWLTHWETGQRVTVTVTTNGTITAPGAMEATPGVIDDVQLLLPSPTMRVAPALVGRAAVGQTVTATLGSWTPAVTWDWASVEWFLDGRPADDYGDGDYLQKFHVTGAAVGKRLAFRITLSDPDGLRAPVAFTSKPVTVPKAAAALSAKLKKGKLTVTVTVPTVPRPTGTVTVLLGRKKIGRANLAARSRGVAVIAVKLKKGRHTLTIAYAGNKTVGPATKTVTVRA